MVKIESFGPEDTFALGKKYGCKAEQGLIFCLDGDLGVGKTVFTQGFADGLGIKEPVCSPTFTILQVYEEGRIPLYHMDAYRIEDPDEMEEIGLPEELAEDGVCLIEWGQQIEELLPDDCIRVTIEKDLSRGFDYRSIVIEGDRT